MIIKRDNGGSRGNRVAGVRCCYTRGAGGSDSGQQGAGYDGGGSFVKHVRTFLPWSISAPNVLALRGYSLRRGGAGFPDTIIPWLHGDFNIYRVILSGKYVFPIIVGGY